MNQVFYPALAAFIIMLASLSGIIFSARRLGGWMERNLQFLVTFSIGIFAVITWELFGEALEHGEGVVVVISVIIGAIAVKILSMLIPDAHHHHDPHPTHPHSRIDARKVIIGDALHNIGDGLLLVPAFIADIQLGIATAIGILLHEIVQEISEYFILREAGYTMKQALTRNFFASGSILIGVGLALSLSSIESLEAPLIGLSAGGFLYILLRDLIPHTIESIHTRGRADRHIQALVFGVLIMLGVNVLLPHSHEEIDAHDELIETQITYEQNI